MFSVNFIATFLVLLNQWLTLTILPATGPYSLMAMTEVVPHARESQKQTTTIEKLNNCVTPTASFPLDEVD